MFQNGIFKALILLVMRGGGEADALDMLGEIQKLFGVREDVLICFIEHEELTLLDLEFHIAVILDSFTEFCYLPKVLKVLTVLLLQNVVRVHHVYLADGVSGLRKDERYRCCYPGLALASSDYVYLPLVFVKEADGGLCQCELEVVRWTLDAVEGVLDHSGPFSHVDDIQDWLTIGFAKLKQESLDALRIVNQHFSL